METKAYSIGIDLGTTNTVMSYVDNRLEKPQPECFKITQLVAPGELMDLPVLPSFIYLPAAGEIKPDLLSLPWNQSMDLAVGTYAREMASSSPDKVVSSSKSWLCNDKIDRHSDCLPYMADGLADARRLSPVTAAAQILGHLRDNWNHVMAAEDASLRIENQDVVITVPASFDAVARELTVEAATSMGLKFTLLEEPQAAFYAWLSDHEESWRKEVSDGDVMLVCDLGGGTSDFSLIAVVSDGGDLALQRLAVGDHTLLGGDNMDLTLAVKMAAKLKAEKNIQLNSRQFLALTHGCRLAKEAFSSGIKKEQPLTILGSGSGLVAGTIKTKLSYEEFEDVLLEGFFPACSITDKPQEARRSGLRTMALEYASDPSFLRHLASFLEKHSFKDGDGQPILPGHVLFNGGVTKSELFRNRLIESLNSWRGAGVPGVSLLSQSNSDLSVSMGASWYGHCKLCGGVRIKAGSSRSYYLGVESPMPAVPGMLPPLDGLCVVPFGMEEGSSAALNIRGLGLVVGEPTEFRFFSSTVRQGDQLGDRVDANGNGDLEELPPLQVTLSPVSEESSGGMGALVPVRLRAELTEIGTLNLWCDDVAGNGSWKLEFSIRGEA